MLQPHVRKCALVLPLIAPICGCSKAMTAETAYAQDVDFSQYRSYRWITDDPVLIQPGIGNASIRNVENENRIRAAVDRELASRGLHKAEGDEAQLIVAFSLGTRIRYQVQGGATSLDMVAGEAAHVTRGELTLYLFDRASDRQVWSAWTKKDLEVGDDPEATINVAVSLLLAAFPPREQ